jgi:hypothetical protein
VEAPGLEWKEMEGGCLYMMSFAGKYHPSFRGGGAVKYAICTSPEKQLVTCYSSMIHFRFLEDAATNEEAGSKNALFVWSCSF